MLEIMSTVKARLWHFLNFLTITKPISYKTETIIIQFQQNVNQAVIEMSVDGICSAHKKQKTSNINNDHLW